MTLGSRGQLHVSRPTCLLILLVSNFIKQIYITLHISILYKAYDIQSPWKYFPNTYMISSQDGLVQEGCDCTVSYTQEQVCHLYLTACDCCRVFPLHRMYERVDTAVVIWCWTST